MVRSISLCQSVKLSSSTVAPNLPMIVLPPTALTRMSIRPKSRTIEPTVACTSLANAQVTTVARQDLY
jgi:hypothetical protein